MAEKKKCSYSKELTKGFLRENPVLRLILGTCPTLATSTSVVNGIGMGIAATIVLICSNVVISALRKVIPSKARIPAYIVIIASFVTMVQMLVKAFVPALDQSLGVFLPLIVVNCIILGRAEAFAGKNPVLLSAVDGLGMGIGFTAALFVMGAVREILGAGTFLSGIDTMLGAYVDLGSFTGFDFTQLMDKAGLTPMTIFILPAGGFFVFGIIMAFANRLAERKGLPSAALNGCKGCPHASFCTIREKEECADKKEETDENNAPKDKSDSENNKEAEEKSDVKATADAPTEEATTEGAPAEEAATEETSTEEAPAEEDPAEEAATEETSTEAVTTEEAVAEEAVAEEAPVEINPVDEIIAEVQHYSSANKKNNKKGRKKKKKENKAQKKPYIPSDDNIEPLPDVIPDIIKRDIEKNKQKKEAEAE